jgi:hypothetical protein
MVQQQHLQKQSIYASDLCDFSYGGAPQLQYGQKSVGGPYYGVSSEQIIFGANRTQNKINTHNNFLSHVGYLVANTTCLQSIKIPRGYS